LYLFGVVTAIAAAFRFPDLAQRPMHADEAIHADEVGTLLEHGRYTYSTADYHGPTLDYLAFAAARLQGMRRLADLNEVTLRAIPAVFGVLLVAGHYLFDSVYRGPGGGVRCAVHRRIAGDGVLQPIFHSRNPARMFHLRRPLGPLGI
jgi:hypothetical protein